MFAKTALTILALAASSVSALPQEPTKIASASLAKRTTHTGTGTVYYQGGGYGSCGQQHSDNDMIVAITPSWQGYSYPPLFCGRKVKITNTGSNYGVGGQGRTIIATVADTCAGCLSANSIDMSFGAWNQLTKNALPSTVEISWNFCNEYGQC